MRSAIVRRRRVVGDDDHGRPLGCGRARRSAPGPARALAGVELPGRLVGEQQRRPVRERRAQRDALALAAGELGRRARRPGRRARGVEQLARRAAGACAGRPRAAPAAARPPRARAGRARAAPRHAGRGTRSSRGAGGPAPRARSRPMSRPPDPDEPGRGHLQPGDHPQQRALAGAARAEHADELAARRPSSVAPWSAAASPSPVRCTQNTSRSSTTVALVAPSGPVRRPERCHAAVLPAAPASPSHHAPRAARRVPERPQRQLGPRRDGHQRRMRDGHGAGRADGGDRQPREQRAPIAGPTSTPRAPASDQPQPQLAPQRRAARRPGRSRSARPARRGAARAARRAARGPPARRTARRRRSASRATAARSAPTRRLALDVGAEAERRAARAGRAERGAQSRAGSAACEIHSSSARPCPGDWASSAEASVGSSATTKPARRPGTVGKRRRTPTTRAAPERRRRSARAGPRAPAAAAVRGRRAPGPGAGRSAARAQDAGLAAWSRSSHRGRPRPCRRDARRPTARQRASCTPATARPAPARAAAGPSAQRWSRSCVAAAGFSPFWWPLVISRPVGSLSSSASSSHAPPRGSRRPQRPRRDRERCRARAESDRRRPDHAGRR